MAGITGEGFHIHVDCFLQLSERFPMRQLHFFLIYTLLLVSLQGQMWQQNDAIFNPSGVPSLAFFLNPVSQILMGMMTRI